MRRDEREIVENDVRALENLLAQFSE
jgi:hypothetical protein